jgi:hypothetical protein
MINVCKVIKPNYVVLINGKFDESSMYKVWSANRLRFTELVTYVEGSSYV